MNWVLLRGLMREARHWGTFPAQLQQAFPDATIITPDLPGNGHLWRERSPTRIEDMVEHCRATLRDLGHTPPYHLLALSLGGMVAKCWSERHPEEVPAMVLINTSMRPYNPFHHRLRPANYAALIRMAFESDPARREETILRLTSARGAVPDVLAAWSGYARECPVSRVNALRQLLAAARFRATGTPQATRVLLLVSCADQLVNEACSHALANAWGAKLAVHSQTGHDLPLDDPEWLKRQVLDWLFS
jgi:pimeloyl-ACP methyl ester carboxylesterase